MDSFEIRIRKDRDYHGRGLIDFVRHGFICRRLTYRKPNNLDCVCSELTSSNKNGSALIPIDHSILKVYTTCSMSSLLVEQS